MVLCPINDNRPIDNLTLKANSAETFKNNNIFLSKILIV